MTDYEIIYDYTDDGGNECTNISESWSGTYSELQSYIKRMRENGCYNISATALYFDEEE